jgi:hypothetical protein
MFAGEFPAQVAPSIPGDFDVRQRQVHYWTDLWRQHLDSRDAVTPEVGPKTSKVVM